MKSDKVEFSSVSDKDGCYKASYGAEGGNVTHELIAKRENSDFKYSIKEYIHNGQTKEPYDRGEVHIDPESVKSRLEERRSARESSREKLDREPVDINKDMGLQKYVMSDILTERILDNG